MGYPVYRGVYQSRTTNRFQINSLNVECAVLFSTAEPFKSRWLVLTPAGYLQDSSHFCKMKISYTLQLDWIAAEMKSKNSFDSPANEKILKHL